MEECARILIRWSMENIHPYYFYGDEMVHLGMNDDDPNDFWDFLVNVLEGYRICVEDMVRDLEQLYTDTMTAFAIRSLIEGKESDARKGGDDRKGLRCDCCRQCRLPVHWLVQRDGR